MSSLRAVVEAEVRQAAAEGGNRTDLVLGEFVVIAATHGWDEDGDDVGQVIVIPDGGSEPRILGLVHHARVRLEADILSEE